MEQCLKNSFLQAKITRIFHFLFSFIILVFYVQTSNSQSIFIDGNAVGKRFDGIGAVSGGGATSVLLKDYPETQRNQVLDLLFKPKFGASISALLVEVPGDGNSTQGSEPSHMHSRIDENYSRGYEWWLMSEAKKRNPALTLDANAWGCPRWVGNNNFWSQDMCDYYAKWIKGLKNVYGLDLDAIGCRNEKGVNEDFVKKFRTTLNNNGLSKVKIHGFDNWDKDKFDWCKDMKTDSILRASADIMSAHTMFEMPASTDAIKLSEDLGKPIWNSEEHIYKKGFDCEISLVESFNMNFIKSGVTKIVNWYLVGSTYSVEPYAEEPAIMIAREPWSGHYYTRDVMWGYAHYGQFCEAGWHYLKGACSNLAGGGSYVTLKSPGSDFSIIVETRDTTKKQTMASQKVTFNISGGLSTANLCVWRSNASSEFEKLNDIVPVNGSFEITFEPNSIYSISTTKGQQKGSFENIPPSSPFPFPYYETFEEYKNATEWGYLPHYTADIAGVFEIAERSDKKGKCLRQVIAEAPQSWAPEWLPYTILGDPNWGDYEVSSDVYIENIGTAGLMGRVNGTGYGWGSQPNGYYATLSSSGECNLYITTQDSKIKPLVLATGKAANITGNQWHKLKICFSGQSITVFVDNNQLISATDTTYSKGVAGLLTGDGPDRRSTVQFDNLIINSVNGSIPNEQNIPINVIPMYKLINK